MPENESIPDDVRQAAARMGSIRTARKAAAARENGKQGGRRPGTQLSPEHKAKIAEAAKRRAAERAAAGLVEPAKEPKEPKPRGRPKKQSVEVTESNPDGQTPAEAL